MIKSKRLVEMTRKWQKVASMGRKASSSRSNEGIADKGHFVVYSADKKRFVVPLQYLSSDIFRELFKMSEEEYGLPGDGPIILPCDAFFMEYVILFVRGYVSKDVERVLLESIDSSRRSKYPGYQGPRLEELEQTKVSCYASNTTSLPGPWVQMGIKPKTSGDSETKEPNSWIATTNGVVVKDMLWEVWDIYVM